MYGPKHFYWNRSDSFPMRIAQMRIQTLHDYIQHANQQTCIIQILKVLWRCGLQHYHLILLSELQKSPQKYITTLQETSASLVVTSTWLTDISTQNITKGNTRNLSCQYCQQKIRQDIQDNKDKIKQASLQLTYSQIETPPNWFQANRISTQQAVHATSRFISGFTN
jgi:hypothetical protein